MLYFAAALIAQPPAEFYTLDLLLKTAIQREIRLDPKLVPEFMKALEGRDREIRTALLEQAEGRGDGIDQEAVHTRVKGKLSVKLTADQKKRLVGITVQRHGLRLLTNPDFARAFNLAPEQFKLFTTLYAEADRRPEIVQEESTPQKVAQGNAAVNKARAKAEAEVWRLLSRGQKAKWKALCGAPFNPKPASPEKTAG